MKVLFIEPPKDIWFIMGEYLPPPFGIIQLGAYLEREIDDIELKILDCNARQITWDQLPKHIEAFEPDIVASSSLATCNTYEVARTLQTAKKVNPEILTVTGGQHFSFQSKESLEAFPEIDVTVRGEGEVTLKEMVKHRMNGESLDDVAGLSYRKDGVIRMNPDRPLIEDLDTLPFPGYHLVRDTMDKYHFQAMAGRNTRYALIEGGRGCHHKCTFCTQWRHWCGVWRVKSMSRIADEVEYVYNEFDSRFVWLTDDNFGSGNKAEKLADELLKRDIGDDLSWFLQLRADDVIKIGHYLPKMRKSGLQWVMMGIESPSVETLNNYRKDLAPDTAFKAIRLLKQNDIFTHGMFIIGDRKDTHESIQDLRDYVERIDPDFAIFTALTPFPGTDVYDHALAQGWIEDHNLYHYDMAHAIMPTETLTRQEVQEELFKCYYSFYGSWSKRIKGIFARNELKRRINWHMAGQGILHKLKDLI